MLPAAARRAVASMLTAGLRQRRVGVRFHPAVESLLAAALGALHSLAFVDMRLWWLQLGLVAVLAWRVAGVAPRRAALLGWLFGTAWLASGTWWLFISLHRYGGLPAPLGVVAVGLLAGLLSLYLAAACAAFSRWRSGRAGPDALLFAAVWLLAELARGVVFTGFSWVETAYAHVESPLAGLAPWVGAYGIGFGAAALAAWIGLPKPATARAWGVPLGAAALVLVAASLLGSVSFTRPTATLGVSLLQTNVAQDEKFSAERLPEALAWTREQLLAARGRLVVAPETVIPLLPEQLDPAYWQSLLEHFRQGRQAALLGLPLGNPDSGYTNSAAGLSAASAKSPDGFYRYDKHHLVPFGEFIPWGFKWFTRMMNIPLGDFNRGPLTAPSFAVPNGAGGDERIAANICYEDLFGEELAARFADPAAAPTIFANISNIAWFGDTIAVRQHLQISRLRTLEFERPMLRATNTGATVVIDHRGRVTAALRPFTRGVLDGEVQGRDGTTPFAWWASRLGLWPALILAAGIVTFALMRWGPWR